MNYKESGYALIIAMIITSIITTSIAHNINNINEFKQIVSAQINE